MAIEKVRGCGFRRIHGLYLVGNYVAVSCDRLPLPVGFCPTCGAGIHFTRSLSEVNPQKLWADHKRCSDKIRPCFVCDPPNALAYVMMVGVKFYPTTSDFVTEAIEQGISKRIPFIPKKLKLGETIVYLAHSKACESYETTEAQLVMDEKQPKMIDTEKKIRKSLGIFCAFIPQRVEQLFYESEINDKLKEKCEKRGVTIIEVPDGDEEHKLC